MDIQAHSSKYIKNDRVTPKSAKSALSTLEHKIYQIDVAISLLSDLEAGNINEVGDGIGRYTYRAIATEYVNNARRGLFDALEEVHDFIGTTGVSLPVSSENRE
ncbi:MAG: hypothetical protein AB2805_12280 [Candidatus Thiodiazotropha sp.]